MNDSLILEIVRQRWRLVLAASLCVVAAIGFTMFRFGWQEPRLSSLRGEWFQKRAQAGGVMRSPVESYRQGKADLATVYGQIPAKQDFVKVLGELYELAGNNRVSLGAVTYKLQSVKDVPLQAYELTVNTAGSYAGVKSFISDIEHMEEMVVINGFVVTGGKDEMGQAVDVRLTLTAYFRTEGA